jgi:hypothetical protein
MRQQQQLTIHNINSDGPAYCEAIGISKVFAAYAEDTSEPIIYDGIGFNSNSGYVYIALENGITIASYMGNNVEYIVTDFYNGDEHFFNSFSDALEFMNIEQSKAYENQ